jgi:hypothetical protein
MRDTAPLGDQVFLLRAPRPRPNPNPIPQPEGEGESAEPRTKAGEPASFVPLHETLHAIPPPQQFTPAPPPLEQFDAAADQEIIATAPRWGLGVGGRHPNPEQ